MRAAVAAGFCRLVGGRAHAVSLATFTISSGLSARRTYSRVVLALHGEYSSNERRPGRHVQATEVLRLDPGQDARRAELDGLLLGRDRVHCPDELAHDGLGILVLQPPVALHQDRELRDRTVEPRPGIVVHLGAVFERCHRTTWRQHHTSRETMAVRI